MGRMYDDYDYQTTADDVRRHKNDVSGRSDPWIKDHIGMWRPKEGKNRIRILPPTWKDATFFSLPVSLHYNVGPDNGQYLCIAKMRGEQCAVCDEHAEIRDDDEEAANAIRRADRSIAYVIDRKAEDEGPQVWLIGYKQDQDLVSLIHDEDTGKILLIAHPGKGQDVIFTRTGTGPRNTQYSGFKLASPSPLSDDEAQAGKWLRRITKEPLPDVLEFKSESELKKLMAGKSKKDDDEDEDEKPKSKKKRPVDDDEDEDEKPAKKKRPVDDDEDEDEKPGKASRKIASDDEDEAPKKSKKPADDDDEDEDEKPKPKRRTLASDEDEDEKPAKKKKPTDDDDEDEEDKLPAKGKRKVVDDDEDEDEKPAKKKRPVDDDEDEDEKPKSKKRRGDDDDDEDEDEKPKSKKKKPADDDDD